VAITKVERLMNLVIALLSTRQFLTADKIRATVAGYGEDASHETFSRMFERDKNDLRELGIPVETGPAPGWGSPEGYRINRDAYELPDVDLTRAEAAAVAVAARLWESPELTRATQRALMKLRAAGVQVDQQPAVPVAAGSRARGSEPALGQLLAAIDAGRAVRFAHLGSAGVAATARDVEPWGVVTDRGRWYLVGFDRDRQAPRTFRLSRIEDIAAYGPPNAVTVPEGVNLRETAASRPAPTTGGTATVWVADERANDVRRLGEIVGSRRIGERDGVLVRLDVRSVDWLARMVAGHGPDAIALEPPELREAVLDRLRAAAALRVEVG
jgi:proteasome accessory factor B